MTIKYKTKLQLQTALKDADNDKKKIYRILLICEKLGLKWNHRQMYGGGTEVSLYDKLDDVAVICFWEKGFSLEFNDEYFDPLFKPTTYEDIRREQIRAEEAIYLSNFHYLPVHKTGTGRYNVLIRNHREETNMKKIMKKIKEINQAIEELKSDYEAGYEVDGEPMTEAEYYLYLEDLKDELREWVGKL